MTSRLLEVRRGNDLAVEAVLLLVLYNGERGLLLTADVREVSGVGGRWGGGADS
jgi:hypothetical protein